jgi:putative hydrolase of the HAD superfamily
MFEQSKPFPTMIEFIAQLKVEHALKVVVVSNEARELNAYRIRKFKLDTFVDFFVSSCCVHMRKPDPDVFRLALELAQVSAGQVAYVENTPMFVQIAGALGIRGVVHVNASSTRAELASLGLPLSGAAQKA